MHDFYARFLVMLRNNNFRRWVRCQGEEQMQCHITAMHNRGIRIGPLRPSYCTAPFSPPAVCSSSSLSPQLGPSIVKSSNILTTLLMYGLFHEQLNLHHLHPPLGHPAPSQWRETVLPWIEDSDQCLVPMKQHVHAACAMDAFGVVQIVPEDHLDATRLDCHVHAKALQVVTLGEEGEGAVQHNLHIGP